MKGGPLHMPTTAPVIRIAIPGDVGTVARVHWAAAIAGYADIFPKDATQPTPESLEPGWVGLINDPDSDVFVAIAEGTLVAAAILAPDTDVPTELLLKRLYVHPSRWGLGIGSMLHDKILAHARRQGATGLNLWVLERNRRARRMYERRGWQLVPGRTLPNEPPSVFDVLYQLELAARAQPKPEREAL